MTVELVTGQGIDDHIGPEDFGAYQAYTYGPGRYILHGCEAEVVNANTVRISEGELLLDGRHVRIKGAEDIPIRSGAVDRNRADLIVIQYRKDSENVEDAPIVALPGTPTEGSAIDPAYTQGSILSGDVAVDIPLYRIKVSGLTVGQPESCIERAGSLWDCLSQKSDKGHTHAAGNITNLLAWIRDKFWPVGRYWLSENPTSPASLIGGTWVQITGRVLRAAADTGTGGTDTITLTTAQMPSHSHNAYQDGKGSFWKWVGNNSGHTATSYLWLGGSDQSWADYKSGATATAGSGSAHSNLPAYKNLYVWRRTA